MQSSSIKPPDAARRQRRAWPQCWVPCGPRPVGRGRSGAGRWWTASKTTPHAARTGRCQRKREGCERPAANSRPTESAALAGSGQLCTVGARWRGGRRNGRRNGQRAREKEEEKKRIIWRRARIKWAFRTCDTSDCKGDLKKGLPPAATSMGCAAGAALRCLSACLPVCLAAPCPARAPSRRRSVTAPYASLFDLGWPSSPATRRSLWPEMAANRTPPGSSPPPGRLGSLRRRRRPWISPASGLGQDVKSSSLGRIWRCSADARLHPDLIPARVR